ncbi:chloride channel protein [candidate division KSB1 bacterium]
MRKWVTVTENSGNTFVDKIKVRLAFLLSKLFPQSLKTEQLFVIVIAVFIGLIGGFGATGFRYLIRIVQRISYGDWSYTLDLVRSIPWYIKVIIPACGGLLVGLIVYFFAREAKGHGVPEVMESVALKAGKIRPRVVFAKAFASSICIGTGGSVGREGPIVQIGSALGSTIGQFFKVPASTLKTFVGCGAAAGIASTFNAPIAGAFFALEIILGDFAVPQFAPIVISSVIATVVSHYFLGNYPAFLIPEYQLISPWELIPYVILGVLAALIGILFIKSIYGLEDFFDSVKFPEYLKPVIGGLIIGSISILFPEILGIGYEAISLALEEKLIWFILLFLIFFKLVAVSITLGSGGSGGIFAPSLFLGAMTGGILGLVVHSLFPGVTASYGAYALVGMGAMVAATTHGPITAIIIIFELTNDYKIILPLMIACIISTVTAMRLKRESIYTMKLIRKKINIFIGKEINILKSLHVKDVMTKDYELVTEDTKLNLLLEKLVKSKHSSLFMVNKYNMYSGIITMHDLRSAFLETDSLQHILIAKDVAISEDYTVTMEDNLDYVIKIFGQKNLDELPIIENINTLKIIGSVSKIRVIEAYNQEILRRDLLGELSNRISDVEKSPLVQLLGGYTMAEIESPKSFVGLSLRDAHIREKFGVEIILIKRTSPEKEEETINIIPDSKYIIREGDKFLIVGDIEKIKDFKFVG